MLLTLSSSFGKPNEEANMKVIRASIAMLALFLGFTAMAEALEPNHKTLSSNRMGEPSPNGGGTGQSTLITVEKI
jgi:hypothetical protein